LKFRVGASESMPVDHAQLAAPTVPMAKPYECAAAASTSEHCFGNQFPSHPENCPVTPVEQPSGTGRGPRVQRPPALLHAIGRMLWE
jgi:hypothetical protein